MSRIRTPEPGEILKTGGFNIPPDAGAAVEVVSIDEPCGAVGCPCRGALAAGLPVLHYREIPESESCS